MGTTKSDIAAWFKDGVDNGSTHMIVATDDFDHDDYPVYVKPGEDPRVKAAGLGDMQRVMEVYAIHLDMDDQLNERRAFHYESAVDSAAAIGAALKEQMSKKLAPKSPAAVKRMKVAMQQRERVLAFEFVSSVDDLPTGDDIVQGTLGSVGTPDKFSYYTWYGGKWNFVDPPLDVRDCEAALGRAARRVQQSKDAMRSFLIQKLLMSDAKPTGEDAMALRAVDLIRASTMQLGVLAERFGRGELAEAVVDAEIECAKALDVLQEAESRAREAESRA